MSAWESATATGTVGDGSLPDNKQECYATRRRKTAKTEEISSEKDLDQHKISLT